MVEWLKAIDCKSIRKYSYVGSNPTFFNITTMKIINFLFTKILFNSFISKKYSKNIKIKPFKDIYGIGDNTILSIKKKYGLNNRIKTPKIKYVVSEKIRKTINKITFKNTLRNKQIEIRKFTVTSLKNYKGFRHLLRYPVRGQRTHSNGKTRKILKKTKNSSLT